MGRSSCLMVVQRGQEVTRVLDPKLAREHLLQTAQAEAQDANIQRLAKAALCKLEQIDNIQYSGIGAAVSSLHTRFNAGDKPVLRQLRHLHEAYNFVRHLTLVGEAKWMEGLEEALARVAPKAEGGPKAAAVATREGGGVAVAVLAKVDEAEAKKSQRRRRKKGLKAMEVDVPVDLTVLPNSVETSVVVAPEALRLLAMGDRQDTLEDDSWADEVQVATGKGRCLSRRRSGSRTPPTKPAARLGIGAACRISGLAARPELEGKEVVVAGYDDTEDRYSILASDGDMVMVPRAALFFLSSSR